MKDKKKRWFRYAGGSASAVIGFVLSPISWWNDLFVNIPLSYLFAYLTGRIFNVFYNITNNIFIGLFVFWYFISNLIGMLMIHYGVSIFVNKNKKLSISIEIVIALVYTLLILLLSYLDVFDIIPKHTIIPDWIK